MCNFRIFSPGNWMVVGVLVTAPFGFKNSRDFFPELIRPLGAEISREGVQGCSWSQWGADRSVRRHAHRHPRPDQSQQPNRSHPRDPRFSYRTQYYITSKTTDSLAPMGSYISESRQTSMQVCEDGREAFSIGRCPLLVGVYAQMRDMPTETESTSGWIYKSCNTIFHNTTRSIMKISSSGSSHMVTVYAIREVDGCCFLLVGDHHAHLDDPSASIEAKAAEGGRESRSRQPHQHQYVPSPVG
jgi:hypothetical protein